MPDVCELLTCPFCLNQCIPAKSGEAICPICGASFEIDDRGECVFGDIENIRLPEVGIICAECGLFKPVTRELPVLRGEINLTIQ